MVHLADSRTVSDARIDALLTWLSPAEVARYQRFVRRERQRQFVLGRVLARQMLGQLLGVAARALLIVDRPGQAPVLEGDGHSAAFSIAHSGPWVACAVSAAGGVGLDIELLDPARDILALAAHAFSDEQYQWLAARPHATRLCDFYVLWSTQEARIKLDAEPAMTVELAHPELAVILCSTVALAHTPRMQLHTL